MNQMQQTPPVELQAEVKSLGRLHLHRLRRVAALLRYYRIDAGTIEDRLVERGCSHELAEWLIRSTSMDTDLSKRIEEEETPEATTQVVLKGMNGLVMLVIVGLVTHAIQVSDNMAFLFVLAPFLLITSFLGFFMTLRAVVELRRRWFDKK